MSSPETVCPHCASPLLKVVYYGAEGDVVGGTSQCTECGTRHGLALAKPAPVQAELLKRKAS